MDSQGVSQDTRLWGFPAADSGDLVYAGGWVFHGGYAIDVATPKTIGPFAPPGSLMAPDLANGRVYTLTAYGPRCALRVCDANTLATLGELNIRDVRGAPGSLRLCGGDRLAFRSASGQVFIRRVDELKVADLRVAQTVSAPRAAVGERLVFQVELASRGSLASGAVTLAASWPDSLAILDASATQGQVQTNDAGLVWDADTLPAGGGATLTLTALARAPGLAWCQASATGDAFETNYDNNALTRYATIVPPPRTGYAQELRVPALSLVYSTNRNRLYAGLGGGVNAVVPIDPGALEFDPPISLGAAAVGLAVADNGQFLYAATDTGGVVRVDLNTRLVDRRIGLGNEPDGGLRFARRLLVLPGQPEVLAVARSVGSVDGPGVDVAIYDRGILRSNVYSVPGEPTLYSIALGLSNTVYCSQRSQFAVLGVSSAGLVPVLAVPGFSPGAGVDFRLGGGRVFFNDGQVLDARSFAPLPGFTAGGLAWPEPGIDRVYFLTQPPDVPERATMRLSGFDATGRGLLWEHRFPPMVGAPAALVQAGTNGLACSTTAGRLYLLDSRRLDSPSAEVVVTHALAPDPVVVGDPVLTTCAVSNAGPWAVSNLWITNLLSPGLSWVSSASSLGSFLRSNAPAVLAVDSLAPGGALELTVESAAIASGPITSALAAAWSVADGSIATRSSIVSSLALDVPELRIDDPVAWVGPVNSTVDFTLSLSHSASHPVLIQTVPTNFTALNGKDYTSALRRLTIPAGALKCSLPVAISGGVGSRTAKTFGISIASAAGATVSKPVGVATIMPGDLSRITPSKASIHQGPGGPDAAVFEFELYPPSYDPIELSYATAPDSGLSGLDFLARAGTLLFASGETRKSVTVPLLSGNGRGGVKRFSLALFRPEQAVLAQPEVEAVWTSSITEAPCAIQGVSAAGGLLQFQFTTVPGVSYQVQRATQLSLPDWRSLGEPVTATNAALHYAEPIFATNRASYYRVVVKP